jgi:hypothetical protein
MSKGSDNAETLDPTARVESLADEDFLQGTFAESCCKVGSIKKRIDS